MKFVIVHINQINNFASYHHCSNTIPEYLWHSILQIKKWGNDDILLIADNSEFNNVKNKMKEYGISKLKFLPYNNYMVGYNLKGLDFFRFVTSFRLIVLYEAMKEFNLTNICHIEYDNLIYFNGNELDKIHESNKVCYSLVGNNLGSAGIMFISNHEVFKPVIDVFKSHYNNETASDMNLLFGCQNMGNVLILPTLEDHPNFSKFNCLFDGASWGQYLGGSPNGHGPGLCDANHYVGQRLINKEYNLGFNNIDGKKTPIVIKNNIGFRLLNLHIHCKKLEEFKS